MAIYNRTQNITEGTGINVSTKDCAVTKYITFIIDVVERSNIVIRICARVQPHAGDVAIALVRIIYGNNLKYQKIFVYVRQQMIILPLLGFALLYLQD